MLTPEQKRVALQAMAKTEAQLRDEFEFYDRTGDLDTAGYLRDSILAGGSYLSGMDLRPRTQHNLRVAAGPDGAIFLCDDYVLYEASGYIDCEGFWEAVEGVCDALKSVSRHVPRRYDYQAIVAYADADAEDIALYTALFDHDPTEEEVWQAIADEAGEAAEDFKTLYYGWEPHRFEIADLSGQHRYKPDDDFQVQMQTVDADGNISSRFAMFDFTPTEAQAFEIIARHEGMSVADLRAEYDGARNRQLTVVNLSDWQRYSRVNFPSGETEPG